MTTATPQSSELAMSIASEAAYSWCECPKPHQIDSSAKEIDVLLAPLRERVEKVEDRFEALAVAIDDFALFMDDVMKGPSTRERGQKIAVELSRLQRLPIDLLEAKS